MAWRLARRGAVGCRILLSGERPARAVCCLLLRLLVVVFYNKLYYFSCN